MNTDMMPTILLHGCAKRKLRLMESREKYVANEFVKTNHSISLNAIMLVVAINIHLSSNKLLRIIDVLDIAQMIVRVCKSMVSSLL